MQIVSRNNTIFIPYIMHFYRGMEYVILIKSGITKHSCIKAQVLWMPLYITTKYYYCFLHPFFYFICCSGDTLFENYCKPPPRRNVTLSATGCVVHPDYWDKLINTNKKGGGVFSTMLIILVILLWNTGLRMKLFPWGVYRLILCRGV